MATVPTPRTWVAGEVVTAAYMNGHVRDIENFLITPPSLFTYQNTAQTALVTGTWTLITFDTNAYDTDTAGATHSTSSNTSRIQPLTAGYHQVIVTLTFTANATGVRLLDLRKNAAGSQASGTRVSFMAETYGSAASVAVTQVVDVVQFNGTTDYVEVFAQQTSGAGLAMFAAATGGSWLGAVSIKTRFLNS